MPNGELVVVTATLALALVVVTLAVAVAGDVERAAGESEPLLTAKAEVGWRLEVPSTKV